MPSFCVVLDCEQKYVHTDDVSFHKFPKDEKLLNQWKLFTGRCESWEPSRWSAICSRHFKENDFSKSASRKILKRNAVPSILLSQHRNSGVITLNEDQPKPILEENINNIFNNSEISQTQKFEKEEKESKIITFQQHLNSNSTNLFSIPTSGNNAVNSVSEIFSIPLDLPMCMESPNLETMPVSSCNISDHDISNNEGHNYDINISGTSSFLNFYESSTAPCRLCGLEDHITNSFLNDFEIFGMIQKCMPTLNIRQDDIFSKEVCSNCLEQLENFNVFVDQVISHQRNLMENIPSIEMLTCKGKHSTVISSVKIKQEPVSNMKVNIKQEIQDTHCPQYTEENGSYQGDNNASEQMNLQDQDDNFPIEAEIEDQKFHFRDSNSLTTREIVKNCDIIEIINLEDGYIDIPDDEIEDSQNKIEQRISNENHPKVIDNKEIKIQKKIIDEKNTESFLELNSIQSSLLQSVIEEHNYTRNFETKIDQKIRDYKQEEPEVYENDQSFCEDESNIKNHDFFGLNCVIQKIETTNSPKKIVPKKEKNMEKNQIIKGIETQANIEKNAIESISSEKFDQENIKISENIENQQKKLDVVLDITDRLIFSDANLSNSSFIRSKTSNKSNIVVINESILKPGDQQSFELRKCLECGLQFFSIDSFNDHQKLHHDKLPFDEIKTSEAICTHFCVLCESNFDSFYDLLKHRSKCRVKNILSTKKSNKISKNVWNCPMCLKIFTSKLALNNHRKYICKFPQNGNRFNCKYCGNYFEKWILCRRHEKLCRLSKMRRTIEKVENVEEQDKSDDIKSNEKDEEIDKKIIFDSESINLENPIDERYNCETCNRSYTRFQNLIRHKKVHRPKNEWNYKCGSCGKRFDRMYDLKIHLKSAECPCVPSKPDTIFFICQICGKKFKTLQILKEHGVTHSDQLPYICQICNKSFKALRNLRQHKITHTNAKTVQCDLCNKTFKRLNGLIQHKRGFHFKIKPHVCEICKHSYSLKGDMLRCKHKYLSL